VVVVVVVVVVVGSSQVLLRPDLSPEHAHAAVRRIAALATVGTIVPAPWAWPGAHQSMSPRIHRILWSVNRM
jgi:hypothetical protein